MRIVLIHPNYHSGGAEIAGKWSPAWVAYLAGYLKAGGYSGHPLHRRDDGRPDRGPASRGTREGKAYRRRRLHLHHALDLQGRARPADRQGGAPERRDGARRHPWHLHVQPGAEGSPVDRRDRARRGRGGSEPRRGRSRPGRWPNDRGQISGIAYREGEKVVATKPAPPIRDVDTIVADWSILDWPKYIYIPMNTRVATPNMARGCPFTCSFCSQWKFWRDYRVRDPKLVVDEIETLVEGAQGRLLHPRRRGAHHQTRRRSWPSARN